MEGSLWLFKLAGLVGVPAAILYWLYLIATERRKYEVKNRVVLITGASSGLGEACARVFFRAGCKLILAGRRREELQRVKDHILEERHNTKIPNIHDPEIFVFDLADAESIERKADELVHIHGRIDILINNAGLSYRGIISDTLLEVDRQLMEINYFGHVALTKALLPCMIDQGGGTVVAVSSVQGKVSIPYRSAYSASKHALQAFFDCLRSEMCDKNIQVCVISPAYIQTNLSLNAICGDGSNYGVMDKTTASGSTPAQVADRILQSVIYRHSDVVLAPKLYKLAIYIRTVFPSLFMKLMAKRAKSQKNEFSKNR